MMFRYWLEENLFKERSRWFSWMPVLFGLGIGIFFALPFEPSLWLGLGAVECLIVLALFFRYNHKVLALLGILSVVVAGFVRVQLEAAYVNKIPFVKEENKLYLKGRIVAADTNSRGNVRLLLGEVYDFDDRELSGLYKITLRDKKVPAPDGQCVEMVAKVMPPFPAAMVGGYQFDRRIFFEGIKATGYAVSRAIPIACEQSVSAGGWFKLQVEKIREGIVQRIDKVLPADEASVTAAIVAGERSGMNKALVDDYRDSGLAHFLSISGLHMSMLAGVTFFLVRFLAALVPWFSARFDSRKAAAVAAVFMSVVYLVISGAAVPTQRAFIMTFIVLLGVLFSRQAISMLTISWAALLILFLSPEALTGPSFQMSFAAVVALIAFYERYAWKLRRFGSGDKKFQSPVSRFFRLAAGYIGGILAADFVASLATLPFSIYHFNRIAVYTTLGNLLAGPIIGLVIMPFVVVALALMPFGLEALPLKVVGQGVHWVNMVTAYVSSLPSAGFSVLSMPLWGLLLIVAGGLWLYLWQEKWRLWGWTGIVFGAFSLFAVSVPDVVVDQSGTAVMVKDNSGRPVVLPSYGKYFVKSVWLNKTGSEALSGEKKEKLRDIWKGKEKDLAWIDLVCGKEKCVYKSRVTIVKNEGILLDGKDFDTQEGLGASIWLKPGRIGVRSVRDYVGKRYWNYTEDEVERQ